MIGGAGLGDVGLGEGAIGRLEAQREGQAATPVGHSRAAVDVEEADAPEQLAPGGADRVLDGGRGDVVIDLEGEVDVAASGTG